MIFLTGCLKKISKRITLFFQKNACRNGFIVFLNNKWLSTYLIQIISKLTFLFEQLTWASPYASIRNVVRKCKGRLMNIRSIGWLHHYWIERMKLLIFTGQIQERFRWLKRKRNIRTLHENTIKSRGEHCNFI